MAESTVRKVFYLVMVHSFGSNAEFLKQREGMIQFAFSTSPSRQPVGNELKGKIAMFWVLPLPHPPKFCFIYFWFGGHIWLFSGLSLGTSSSSAWDTKGCQGLDPGRIHVKQKPYPLYYHSGLPVY